MPKLKSILPVLLSLLFVFGYSFFLQAGTTPNIQFTQDVILELSGITKGDLLISQGSAADGIEVSGKNLTVSSIPAGSSFTLKTPAYARILSVTAVNAPVSLSFSSDNLTDGKVASFTLSSTDKSAKASIIWTVPSSNTGYLVKANGDSYNVFYPNAQSEMSFDYSTDLTISRTLTLETYYGAPAFTSPKPDTYNTQLESSDGNNVEAINVPSDAYQIAISTTPDFKNVSWENIDDAKIKAIGKTTETIYVKFRTKSGKVSDIITYEPKGSNIALSEGDIVKTIDSPDVYIIKYKNSKQYKRLILSPSVFNSYQHLKWENIKTVSQTQMDKYTTSSLVQVAGDNNIYELFPAGDTGRRKVYIPDTSYDSDSVYEINNVDRDSYGME